eukprot:scaffold2599_cov125-Cylindrotheca_fusiformis.AAC.14
MSSSSSSSSSSNVHELRCTFDQLRKRRSNSGNKIFLLDGGTGEELFRRGVPDDRQIWSATALVGQQYQDTLRSVHKSFLQAGALAVTTNSYGVVPGVGFTKVEERQEYIALSGKIAREAISSSSAASNGFVFGSLGPLVESYRADLIKDYEEGVEDYKVACAALLPYVDAFLAETMSCVKESAQAMGAVAAMDKSIPMLLSYTLDAEGRLRDGVSVTQGIRDVLKVSQEKNIELLAILFNCAKPEAITTALRSISSDDALVQLLDQTGVLLGAYANRLTEVDPEWTLAESESAQPFRDDLNEKQYWEFIKLWTEEYGVQIVGGCCGITPEHISYLRDRLADKVIKSIS